MRFLKLKPLLSSLDRDIVGIDLSSNTLKLAHVKNTSKGMEVVNLLSRDIGSLGDVDIVKTLRSALGELQAKNPLLIGMIPAHMVITKNIEIPSTDQKEIREIINLQAGRHTPYSREEIVVDYVELGVFKHNYVKILLVIVARSVIKKHFEICDKAGLKLERMLFTSEGLAYAFSRLTKQENENEPLGLVHMDDQTSDFSVIIGKKIVFVRSMGLGAHHFLTEKEKYRLKLVEEIKKSIEAYQIEDINKLPKSYFLTGAIGELGDLEVFLSNNIYQPIHVVPYTQVCVFSQKSLQAIADSKYMSFFDVIATLLFWKDLKINLIPEEVKIKRSFQERGEDLLKAGILALSVFVLIFSIFISKIYFKSTYLKKLDASFQNYNQEAQKLEKEFSGTMMIKNCLAQRGYALEVLMELYNIVPSAMQLNDIRYDADGKFSTQGTAKTMSVVFSFIHEMEKSGYFKDVKSRYTTKRKDGRLDVTDFEIIAICEKKTD